MSTEAARHLLDEFNDGNWDEVGAYFNDDFELFFDYLEKYNLSGELDIHYVDSEFENLILLKRLEKNPQECLQYICDNIITDVYPMKDGYYLSLSGREELAELFKSSSRNDDDYRAAKAVLGEDYWDPFWDTTSDVYSDVIEELDDYNLQHLSVYILNQIGGKKFPSSDYDDEFFEEMSDEEGYFEINNENVMELLNNEHAMNEMLKEDLGDLKQELYNIHSNAYNVAYTDEIYNDVWRELETIFGKEIHNEERTKANGTRYYVEYIKINDFKYYIEKFLSDNKNSQWSDDRLTYYTIFCDVLNYMMEDGSIERLSFRVPDYPDWTAIKKNINEMFRDYI